MRATNALALLLLAATPLAAEQKTPPPPGPPRPVKLPAITERTLPNGLTVVMAPLANIPKITALLAFRVGQATEREKHAGIAQLCASVATEGTATRTGKQVKEELRSIGGSLAMASDEDQTSISASSLSEFAPRLLALMSDVAQHPAFPEREVALAKENLLEGLKAQRASPDFLVNERFRKAVFGAHPYGFVAPDEAQVEALARPELQAFAATYYVPNNAQLIVVGDFAAGPLFAQVQQAFAAWKKGAAYAPSLPEPPRRDKRQIYFVDRPGSVQSSIYVGNVTIARKHPDYFVLRTANVIYGGSFYSRLTKNIREGKGYTYSPFSTVDTKAHSGYLAVGASVRNEVTGPTLVEIFYELDRMRVLPVEKEELEGAKAYSVGNFTVELASQGGLAGRLNTIYEYDLAKTFIQDFRAKIEALEAADIERAAARYFDTYRAAVAIVGDWEKVKDQVLPFGEVTLYTPEGEQKQP